MEKRHTQGEWKLEEDGYIISQLNRQGICQLQGAPHNEEEANAKLIAAAPELLYALNKCLAVIGKRLDGKGEHTEEEFRAALLGIKIFKKATT